jgi:hypothetical protein
MAGLASVDLQLDRAYVLGRVRGLLEQPATGPSGAFVRTIELKDLAGPGGTSTVLQITLEPWLRGASGQPASLQRTYQLTLRVTPHLVTPATVPDPTRRSQLLCGAAGPSCTRQQGLWLTFDLQELRNVSFGRPACTTPDAIDAQVVPEIYANLGRQTPLALPTDSIAAVLVSAGVDGGSPTDVTVSGDGSLKVGLRFDGPAHAFDRATELLAHYPGRDWVANLDTGILDATVRAKVLRTLLAMSPSATLTSFATSFTPGEIRATAVATFRLDRICGPAPSVTIGVRAPTQLCRDATGASVILSTQESTTGTTSVCIALAQFFSSIGVGTASALPEVLSTVTFEAGVDDVFYGTDLDLDRAFAIVGRSTVMDRQAAAAGQPRPPAPGPCPGVH